MCEINPAHTLIFRLEVYTSDKRMTSDEFEKKVYALVFDTEMKLNENYQFRFHIHDTREHS